MSSVTFAPVSSPDKIVHKHKVETIVDSRDDDDTELRTNIGATNNDNVLLVLCHLSAAGCTEERPSDVRETIASQ